MTARTCIKPNSVDQDLKQERGTTYFRQSKAIVLQASSSKHFSCSASMLETEGWRHEHLKSRPVSTCGDGDSKILINLK